MLTTQSFFSSLPSGHASLFDRQAPVWEALIRLKEYFASYTFPTLPADINSGIPLPQTVALHEGKIISRGLTISGGDATKGKMSVYQGDRLLEGAAVIMAGAVLQGPKIALGKGVLIETGALVKGPVIIGEQTEIRQGAYLRGHCLAGARCVIGHVTEVKHSIFLDDAKAGHFAYLGDSILGNDVNLGAGTKLANLRFLGGNVTIRTSTGAVETGMRKFGAILGDGTQTGCNSVTNPGTVIGPKAVVLPNTTTPSGYHPANAVIR